MNSIMLGNVLREMAREVGNTGCNVVEPRDVEEVINVLARIVEGKPLARAFGAPGDWGDSTAIGKALAAAQAPATGGRRCGMKRELCALYVGYSVFYFRSRGEAGMAAAAMASALSADGAASPDAPHVKVTLATVSPRIECVCLDIPRAARALVSGRARSRLIGGAA